MLPTENQLEQIQFRSTAAEEGRKEELRPRCRHAMPPLLSLEFPFPELKQPVRDQQSLFMATRSFRRGGGGVGGHWIPTLDWISSRLVSFDVVSRETTRGSSVQLAS
ncbi:hypothetical protein AXG93_4448s1210 [Marchantia polymorpha subsp. ruderalis]|uniref:Uncharacterized protein n=1 Tax=Marchantia polymorpha subsp. ruderalis TaxID=1480154 RepID=A0A176VFW8_MARPO|nr:hypothetical protein AXG93_4448s1210 [Marchantia polymorpha subsp. ruderalis]